MKNVYIFVIGVICLFLCIGCGSEKEKTLMICKNTLKSEIENLSKEKITITFLSNHKVKRVITGIYSEKDIDGEKMNTVIEALKQNYCNSEIQKDYFCDITNMEKLTLEEEGKSNDVIGIEKDVSIEEYQKLLEEKGFKCTKKK